MSADYSADGPEGTSHDGYVYVVSHKHYNDVFVNGISPPGRNPSVYDAWVGSNCDVTGVEPASAAFVMLDSDRERMRRYASEISSRRYRPTFLYQVRLNNNMFNFRTSIMEALQTLQDSIPVRRLSLPELAITVPTSLWISAGSVAGVDINNVEVYENNLLHSAVSNVEPDFRPGFNPRIRPVINSEPYPASALDSGRNIANETVNVDLVDKDILFNQIPLLPSASVGSYVYTDARAPSMLTNSQCLNLPEKPRKIKIRTLLAKKLLPIIFPEN